MKIKMIAAAALVPAAAAAVALSAGTTAKASPPQHSASTSALRSADVRAHAAAAKAKDAARGKPDPARTTGKHAAKHAARPAGARHAQARAAQADQAQADQAQADQAQADQAQAPQQAQSAAPSQQSISAGESSFEQCVAWRESGDNPTDPDGLFGILPSTWASLGYSGTAGEASVAQQKIAFNRLYAEYGTQPWAPSDGC